MKFEQYKWILNHYNPAAQQKIAAEYPFVELDSEETCENLYLEIKWFAHNNFEPI